MKSERDPALRVFLDDAKRQGLSIRQYEAKYRLLLLPQEQDIASHEVALNEALGLQSGCVPYGEDYTAGDIRDAIRRHVADESQRNAALAALDGLGHEETTPDETFEAVLLIVSLPANDCD
jgi:hypothetical protein